MASWVPVLKGIYDTRQVTMAQFGIVLLQLPQNRHLVLCMSPLPLASP